MRWTTLGAAAVAVGSSCANAANFPRAAAGKGYLSIPVGTTNKPSKKDDDGDSDAKRKTKRDAILMELDNRDFFYSAEVEIGEPPQGVTVLVDTGSNELWVNPDCNNVPSLTQYRQCVNAGSYNPDKSNTPPVGPYGRETINYGDASDPSTHTSATLRYYRDTLTFGEAEIRNQTFGVVVSSDGISSGIMGLAPDLRAGFDNRDDPYSLLLNTMADQGLIESRVFALDLRHAEAATGAVIYGGVDRNKYIGNLGTLPIVRGEQGEYRLAVRMQTLGVTVNGETTQYDVEDEDTNVMLDSGTTLTRMHYQAAYPLLEALGAQDDGEGFYVTDCSNRNAAGSVNFGFGDKTVRVPFSDFILDMGASYCYIGVVITTEQQILGDSVLRAGYFVFDWDKEEVHIGQAANCGKDDIVAVGPDDDISSIKGKCSSEDAIMTKLPDAGSTRTINPEAPSSSVTTTYTITSCPSFDLQCETGLVTTATIPVRPTVTVTGSAGDNSDDGGDDGDDGNAAWSNAPLSMALVVLGAFAVGFNLV